MNIGNPKIEYPLQLKVYKGRYTICDAIGREIFRIDVIRPSLESWKALQDWGKYFCELANKDHTLDPVVDMESELEPISANGAEKFDNGAQPRNPWGRKGKPK